jgi:hypothetical protein
MLYAQRPYVMQPGEDDADGFQGPGRPRRPRLL